MSKSSFSERTFRLLRSFCPPHLLEEIEGDLLQKFEKDKKAVGERKAKRKLFWNVIRFCRPGIVLRNKTTMRIIPTNMIYHFIKTFIRNARRRAAYSVISLSGLVLGIVAFALIGLYVVNEKSYDNFHVKKDRIFRVRQDRYTNGAITRQWTAGPWGIGRD